MYNLKLKKHQCGKKKGSSSALGSVKGLKKIWEKSGSGGNIAKSLLFEALYGDDAVEMMKVYPSGKVKHQL